MASPLSGPTDYHLARKLQHEYLALSQQQWEQERQSEAIARQLESELKQERKQKELDQLSEAVALKLASDFQREVESKDQLSETVALRLALDFQREARARDEAVALKLANDLQREMEYSDAKLSARRPGRDTAFEMRTERRARSRAGEFGAGTRRSSSKTLVDIDVLIQNEFRAPTPLVSPLRGSPSSSRASVRRSRVVSTIRRPMRTRAVDIDHMTYEELQLLCERNGDVKSRGASVGAVSRLPTSSFQKIGDGHEEDSSCSICLMPFEKQQMIKTLPCFHKFHADEIDKWLITSNSCPICKIPADSGESPFPRC